MSESAITGIHHVQITIAPGQEEACTRFYGHLLGLQSFPSSTGRGGPWFKAGYTELHMSAEEGADGGASKRHVCFMVNGLDALKARLADAGCAIQEKGPVNGLRRFFTRDPAGNRIELAEPC